MTSKNVSLFDFNGHQVRVVDRDGAPWFVVKDVCVALNFHVSVKGQVNVTQATQSLGPDEVGLCQVETHPGTHKPLTTYKAVSESGLYKLVMRSDKPEAKSFQDWVTKVVLPAIRS